jgi:hypothetical protein
MKNVLWMRELGGMYYREQTASAEEEASKRAKYQADCRELE